MDTRTLIINTATGLFQQKGYKGVGLNEILKACNISKGALYHHFPNGKEELLIACLQAMFEAITKDIEEIFKQQPNMEEAMNAMIEKLIFHYETTGTINGYTFSSIVSEMGSLSDPIRNTCAQLYQKIQTIYFNKLVADGFTEEAAHSAALMLTALIEGGIMLCLTKQTSEPLRRIAQLLPKTVLRK